MRTLGDDGIKATPPTHTHPKRKSAGEDHAWEVFTDAILSKACAYELIFLINSVVASWHAYSVIC